MGTALILVAGLLLWLRPFVLAAYHVEVAGRLLVTALGPGAAGPLDPGTISATPHASADLGPVFAHLHAALKQDDQYVQAYRLLGRTAARGGDYDMALAAFNKYCRLRPADPLVVVEMAATYRALASTDPERANQGLLQAWRDADMSPHDLLDRGEEDRVAGDVNEALFWFNQALALDPTFGDAWFRTGQVYTAQQDWAHAVEAYQEADLFLPDDGRVQFELGWALYQQTGDAYSAEPYLRRAADLLPDDVWPTLRLAALLRAQGRLVEALDLARGTAQSFPDDPWPLIYQGRIHLQGGEANLAAEALSRAIAISPPEAEAFYLLGQAYAQQQQWEQAVQATRQAIALKPTHDYYFVALGQAYEAAGKSAEAREAFQQALQYNPQNEAARQALETMGGARR